MSDSTTFRAFRVHNGGDGYRAGIETMAVAALSPGEVTVKTAWSGVNYKDALAGTGKGKILRRFPLNAGIDAGGYVVASSDPAFREGDEVLMTGGGLGERRDGGFAEYVRMPASEVIGLPDGLTLREAMAIGTAGFTAALALHQMQRNGQTPAMGPIVVTGATGGLGMLALSIFTSAGYEVHAISGKPERFDQLIELGARQCISRHGLFWGQRPLESVRWAGAVDCVGSDMLAGLTRVVGPLGNIACCGLVAGPELATTVMPFILRGVNLLGIASTDTPRDVREAIWQHLGSDWKPTHLNLIAANECGLDGLPEVFDTLLAGAAATRTVVKLA